MRPGDWLFDFDNDAESKRLTRTVLHMFKYSTATKEKVVNAREIVRRRQRETMQVLRKELLI